MIIGYGCCNSDLFTSLPIIDYKKLTLIDIYDNSCSFVESLRIKNCPILKRIQIGKCCFKSSSSSSVVITNCPQLTGLTIGFKTFIVLKTFVLDSKRIQ